MIEQRVRDGVATVTAADFGPLNRYDVDFAVELRDVVVDLADSDAVKIIVLRADGPDFCPGPREWSDPAPVGGEEVWTVWEQAFAGSRALYQSLCFSKKVTLTAVSGACTGAGSILVLCSDITVASRDTTIRSPFSTVPEANLVLAALTMRLNRAKAWMLRDSTLSSAQAVDAGLVNEVVEAGELDAAVARTARSVTRMPLDGITMSKMLQQSVLDAHGVGREFDLAGFYATALWQARSASEGSSRS